MDKVIVLMSTYNGEKYLKQQLDSLLKQEGIELKILIRDDGSTDNTVKILSDYSSKYPNIYYFLGKNMRTRDSFFELLQNAPCADYYAFCDQDDYWEPCKIITAINMIKTKTSELPILYCSNLKIVDENLKFRRLNRGKKIHLNNKFYAFTEFPAVGCTEVFNYNAASLIRNNISYKCLMHDSWAFSICQFFGEVIYDHNAYISYRQHNNNVIGASKSVASKYICKIKRLFDRSLQPRLQNTCAFYEQFDNIIHKDDKNELLKIIDYKSSVFSRIKLLFDNKIVGFTALDTIRLKLIILLGLF